MLESLNGQGGFAIHQGSLTGETPVLDILLALLTHPAPRCGQPRQRFLPTRHAEQQNRSLHRTLRGELLRIGKELLPVTHGIIQQADILSNRRLPGKIIAIRLPAVLLRQKLDGPLRLGQANIGIDDLAYQPLVAGFLLQLIVQSGQQSFIVKQPRCQTQDGLPGGIFPGFPSQKPPLLQGVNRFAMPF